MSSPPATACWLPTCVTRGSWGRRWRRRGSTCRRRPMCCQSACWSTCSRSTGEHEVVCGCAAAAAAAARWCASKQCVHHWQHLHCHAPTRSCASPFAVDPARRSREVVRWLAERLRCAAMVVYEQIQPHDAFGRQMLLNLESRGCALLGIEGGCGAEGACGGVAMLLLQRGGSGAVMMSPPMYERGLSVRPVMRRPCCRRHRCCCCCCCSHADA